MCGIIGVIVAPGTQNVNTNEMVINQFEDQNSRGKEGFGIIRIKDKKIEGIDRACTPMKFLMDLYTHPAETIIAHHRTPTSTANKLAQTHPMFISNPELKFDYLVIHNGVIQNDDVLKEEHEKLGYKYLTAYESVYGYSVQYSRVKWNDSEGLAIDLARFIEKLQPEMKIEGGAAFMAVQIEKGTNNVTKIYYGRRTNPLNLQAEKGCLFLSSEGPGEEIATHKLFSIDMAKPSMNRKGFFIIQSKSIKFEDERLRKEEEKLKEQEEKKKKKEFKEIVKQNDATINQTETGTPAQLALATIPKQETIQDEMMSALQAFKEVYTNKLDELDAEYADKKLLGPGRGVVTITTDIDIGITERKTLISDVLDTYTESMIEDEWNGIENKLRKQTTMIIISKIMDSINKIIIDENIELEQAELMEDEIDGGFNSNISKTYRHDHDNIRSYDRTPMYDNF